MKECNPDNDLIMNEKEMKIFMDTKKQLHTDAFVAFAFKRCKNGLYISRYIEGEFDRKYLLEVIEGALKFYHFVEKRSEELENAVTGKEKENIETMDGGIQ